MTKELLGQGAFGSVFLAIRKTDGLKVAVKVCNSAYIAKEISILISLKSQKHSNVVGIIDLFEQGNMLLIVLEYCNKGTLYDMLASRELTFDPMKESKIVNIITQIALGLQFLHLNNISHRDIKPENILRTVQNQMEIFKITDFGLSAKEERMTTQKVGTAYYLAPEILNGQAYDKKVDIWALGLLLDELLHGTPFYNGKNDEEVFNKIRTQQFEIRDDQYRNASVFDRQKQAIRTVLMKTIQRDPVMRADLSWVIQQLQEYLIQSPVETGFQGYKFEQPQIDQQFQLPIDLRFCTIHNITYDKNCIKCSDEVYKQKAYLELAKVKLEDFFQGAVQDALMNIDSKLQPTELFQMEFRQIYAQSLVLIKNDFALYLADLQSSIKQPWIDDALNSSQPDNKIVNFVWCWLQMKKDSLRAELQAYVEVQINTLCKEIRAKLHI